MSDTTPTPPPEGAPGQPPPTSEQPSTPPGGYAPPQPGGPTGGPPPGGYAPAPGQGYGPPLAGGVGQPADLLMRFLARFIDGILVGIVNAIITAVLVAGILGLNAGGYGFSTGASFAAGAITSVITAALYLGYFALMESRNGQTVGKMLLKLQTQGPSGGTPTLEEALKRNAWSALGILGVIPIIGGIVGGLGELAAVIMIAVTISQSPTKQGWHDNFAGGTRVVKIG
jgi:uncharacterized RDD family membrane protein YckC